MAKGGMMRLSEINQWAANRSFQGTPHNPGIAATMREFKKGTLHSGSGKKVTSRKQAIAIGLSQERKAGKKIPKKRG